MIFPGLVNLIAILIQFIDVLFSRFSILWYCSGIDDVSEVCQYVFLFYFISTVVELFPQFSNSLMQDYIISSALAMEIS